MSRQYFGTDGVRGRYNGPVVNDAFAGRLARAAVVFFREKYREGLKRAVVGRDTRASGEPLAAALSKALVESGLEVCDAGVVPTPAVAGAMDELGAKIGIMITASHNPATDNGIKFFGEGGRKLTDDEELRIEQHLAADTSSRRPGGVYRRTEIESRYIARMQKALPAGSLRDWRIVVDAAHGATAVTTPSVLSALGAELTLLGVEPNGANINDGVGSQHPEKMAETVRTTGARLGIAHDGDGDRVVLCDENGDLLDGDDLLAILGLHALKNNTLPHRTLVATVQSNLGLDRTLESAGGKVARTAVGDRYVTDEMDRGGFRIGGESSGHLVLPDLSPAGDGLASALMIVRVMLETGEPLSRLRRCWEKFPQVSDNLRVRKKIPLNDLPGFASAFSEAERRLGERGRILIRYSGTEPILRFLVEGEDPEEIRTLLASLRSAAAAELT